MLYAATSWGCGGVTIWIPCIRVHVSNKLTPDIALERKQDGE